MSDLSEFTPKKPPKKTCPATTHLSYEDSMRLAKYVHSRNELDGTEITASHVQRRAIREFLDRQEAMNGFNNHSEPESTERS